MIEITHGDTTTLGARCTRDGTNFCLLARSASDVDLLLFDRVDDAEPARTIPLRDGGHRTRNYWHVHVAGVGPGQLYGWRVRRGPDAPVDDRADQEKVLLDPYAPGVALPRGPVREAARRPGRNDALAPKSVVVQEDDFDWGDDEPPEVPLDRMVIYELHVGRFTRHPSSGVPAELRGTWLGVTHKIPYLLDLGITTVELMPCFQFDEQQAPAGRRNVWGYDPMSFFAPHLGYATSPDPRVARAEFRTMVRELHRAGIEVLLDVVYNHTAEGGADGPTYSWRGLANSLYYTLDEGTGAYADFTGCGNTINANESVTRRMILDSLRHWARDMHVDGFRFDLASILSRDRRGRVLRNPPVLWDIETDPILARTKLVAEAWDAAGLYQVGSFEGDFWHEWNGKFRDDVRAFFRGDRGVAGRVAMRILASPDVYEAEAREPEQSVNFVTCHDGMTLNDVVTYADKHNEPNGQANVDGNNDEVRWNGGVEGPTADPELEGRRNRLVKSMLAVDLLAVGIPMLAMGDEFRRTQHGNNNPWCETLPEDSPPGAEPHPPGPYDVDWTTLARHRDVHRFVRELIALRHQLWPFENRHRLTLTEFLRRTRIRWHGIALDKPDWSEPSHSLAFGVEGDTWELYTILNAWSEQLEFELPRIHRNFGVWRRLLDTALDAPEDIRPLDDARTVRSASYVAEPGAVVMLARPRAPARR
ncbi:MAG: glycogen-debranching protein [Planctomycetes bacterium]|nr:glycogen-debranching protein [Planctomycetota bacterium]